MEKRSLSQLDIDSAREILRQRAGADLSTLPTKDLIGIIAIRYSKIRGRPIGKLSRNQAYAIAERLYQQAYEIVSETGKTSLESQLFL